MSAHEMGRSGQRSSSRAVDTSERRAATAGARRPAQRGGEAGAGGGKRAGPKDRPGLAAGGGRVQVAGGVDAADDISNGICQGLVAIPSVVGGWWHAPAGTADRTGW